jgi:hypothetical protein
MQIWFLITRDGFKPTSRRGCFFCAAAENDEYADSSDRRHFGTRPATRLVSERDSWIATSVCILHTNELVLSHATVHAQLAIGKNRLGGPLATGRAAADFVDPLCASRLHLVGHCRTARIRYTAP